MEAFLERYPRTIILNTGEQVTLRPLQEDDGDRLVQLFQGVSDEDLRVMRDNVSDPRVVRAWASSIDHERVLSIVAEVNDEIWGLVNLHRPHTMYATVGQFRLFVRDGARDKGLGTHLLHDVIEVARDLGLQQLLVELFLNNLNMISAFERRGFEREAILPVYQMVVMRYNLGTRPGREVLAIDHANQLPSRADWPDLIFDPDILEIPQAFNLTDLLLDQPVAAGWGNRPAIYYRNEIVTYELLLGEVKRFASSLARLGVKAGDPVLLHMTNSPQAIAANFAVQRLGALSVPTVAQFSARELALILKDSGAVAAITTAELADDLLSVRSSEGSQLGPIISVGGDNQPDENLYSYAQLVSRGHPDCPATPRNQKEIALLLYTSADSGRPRGTAHRMDGLLAVLDTFGQRVWRTNEEDIVGALAPLGFAQAFVTLGLLPFRFGASVALPDDPMADSGDALAATIRKHRVALLMASPTAYREILAQESEDPLEFASLRLCSSGGEALTLETYEAWEKRFDQPIFEGFGTTEMLYAFLSNAVDMEPRPGSLGRPVPGYEVRVVNDHGTELSHGEIGFLVVRGPTGVLYWNNPESQRQSVRNGWNRMRDYAYLDKDGYFWFVARTDDLIKTRSYRIDPNEVEEAILEHPAVGEAAVIGLPDDMRGQRPVAYVVTNGREEPDGALARSIIGSLRGHLADYKVPDEIVFVDALPRNHQGHLLRRVLLDQVRRDVEE